MQKGETERSGDGAAPTTEVPSAVKREHEATELLDIARGSRPTAPLGPELRGNRPTTPMPGVPDRRRRLLRLDPGAVLSKRYRIERYVASGGMGEVYEATDLELSERVALKTIRPELAADGRMVSRFKREIQAARKVTHPNVCRTLEMGQHQATDDIPTMTFLTMEFLDGETLNHRIRRAGPMTPEQAAPIVLQIASALQAAHEAGVVHRDLKPDNVMLVKTKQGTRAVVTDFSIAREIAAAPDADDEPHPTPADSQMSVLAGTPAYMAPELFEGSAPSPASDLYAFGGVIFQMLTGEWNAKRPSSLTEAQAAGATPPPSLRLHGKRIPAEWDAIVRRCLDPDPKRRFRSANEIAKALRPSATRRHRRWIAAGIATIVVLAATLVGYRMWFSDGATAAQAYRTAMRELRVLENAKARSILEDAVAAHPADYHLQYGLSLAWLQLGDHTRARAAALQAQKLAAHASNEDKQLIEASLIEADQKAWQKAADIYRGLWNRHPSDDTAALRLLYLQCLYRDGSAQKTVEAIRQTLPALEHDPLFLYLQGAAAIANEDYKGTPAKTRAAVDAAKHANLRALTAYALLDHTTSLRIEGKFDESLQLTRDTRKMFESLGDRGAAMKALGFVSKAEAMKGHVEEADAGYHLVLEASQEMGDSMARMFVLSRLGDLYADNAKRRDEARRYLTDAVKLAREVGVQNVEVRALSALLRFHAVAHEWEAMEPVSQQLMKTSQALDSPFYLTNGYRLLSVKRFEFGDAAGARGLLEKCVAMGDRLDFETRIGDLIELADVRNQLGDADAAKQLLADAAKLWDPAHASRFLYQARLEEAALYVDNDELDRAAKTLDEIEPNLLPTDNASRSFSTALRARIAHLAGHTRQANELADAATKLLATDDAAELRETLQVVVAPALASGGAQLLEHVLAAAKDGRKALAWRAQLALAEIEIAHGQRAEAQARLHTLQQETEQAGYRLLAGKAAVLARR